MSRTLVVEPEAEAEIAQSADWYEQRNPVARRRFLRAVDQALHLIEEGPEQSDRLSAGPKNACRWLSVCDFL
jgi:plasmid stabilization system protein ParE